MKCYGNHVSNYRAPEHTLPAGAVEMQCNSVDWIMIA